MVAFVIVSHSEKLAEGVAEIAQMMARDVTILPAGGLPDGETGTSLERITAAVKEAENEDGVILLADMGSAFMTAEMALEELSLPNAIIADCPLCEGAVTGAVLADAGCELAEILAELEKVGGQKKR